MQEDESKLGVSQGEGPQTQVGGGVGDGTEDELDGLDQLMDEKLIDGVSVVDFLFSVQKILEKIQAKEFVFVSLWEKNDKPESEQNLVSNHCFSSV